MNSLKNALERTFVYVYFRNSILMTYSMLIFKIPFADDGGIHVLCKRLKPLLRTTNTRLKNMVITKSEPAAGEVLLHRL